MNRNKLPLILLVLGLAACSSKPERTNFYKTPDASRPLVDDQYKLSADRQKFDEMRTQIPAAKQNENDEMAFVMQLLNGSDRDPSAIRTQFDNALHKKRDNFNKDIQKERDVFTKQERDARDTFLKGLDTDRKEYLKSKHSSDERTEFFSAQDEKRKTFFENQKEKRSDFESDVTERRRNFDDYAREKSAQFLDEWRTYSRQYQDKQKQKEKDKEKAQQARAALQGSSTGVPAASGDAPATGKPTEVKSMLEEFSGIPSNPGTPLESGE